MREQLTRIGAFVLLVGMGWITLAFAPQAAAYPKPAPVPARWELTFEPGDLRLYVDEYTGEAYWFFTYKIINRTGAQRIWAPTFVLYNDQGEIMTSGRDVPAKVTQDLLDLLDNDFMESQSRLIGEIREGAEFAKEGIVIWPVNEFDVNEITIFIAGLSGETARVTNPRTGEEIILRKTLERNYLVRGNALARGTKPVEFVSQRWILR
jgi:hypothetical protein